MWFPEPVMLADPERLIRSTRMRTWRERWCSRPWRPWVREQVELVPDPVLLYDVNRRLYIGHPATIRAAKALWKEQARRVMAS